MGESKESDNFFWLGLFLSMGGILLVANTFVSGQVPAHALLGSEDHSGRSTIESMHWEYVLSWLQVVCVPIGAALLGRYGPSAGSRKAAGRLVAFVALAVYTVAFSQTYHAGVLFLAIVAWIIATFHAKDLSKVDGVVEELQSAANQTVKELSEVSSSAQQINKALERTSFGLRAVSEGRVRAFYDEFYQAMKLVKPGAAVLSVERRWTMEYRAWPMMLDGGSCDTQGLLKFVNAIRRTQFYIAISKSPTTRFLFIGPMPHRGDGYTEEGFSEFIALVYTMCVLEIVRIDRLKAAEDTSEVSIHAQCAIAKVPLWAKIVDDQYWILQGNPRSYFIIERHQSGKEEWAAEHVSGLGTTRQIIQMFDRNARRAHEHVSALFMEAAVTLGKSADEEIQYWLRDFVNFLMGDLSGTKFRDYIRTERNRPSRESLGENSIDVLLALFLSLHSLEVLSLSGANIQSAFQQATAASLWRRSA